MDRHFLAATALAAAFSLAIAVAAAQDTGGEAAPKQGGQAATGAQPGPGMMRGQSMMRGPGMMGAPGRGMRGGRHGAMGPMMMRVMFVAIDADGNGTLSLEEVQSFHARMFAAADEDGDGELAPEELRQFMIGDIDE